MKNYWEFSGEVVRIKEHTFHDVGATLTIKGTSHNENEMAVNIIEMPLMLNGEMWQDLKSQGIKAYSFLELSGHFECWVNVSESNNVRNRIVYKVDHAVLIKH